MKSLLLWMCGLLFISLTGAHELTPFPEHVVVAKNTDEITLTCHTQAEGPVNWKFHSDRIEDVTLGGPIKQVGQNLVFSQVNSLMLGEYSCWKGSEMLSSTYLLEAGEEEDEDEVEEEDEEGVKKEECDNEEEEETDGPFVCRARSYDCTFSCKWLLPGYRAVRFGEGRDCSEGGKTCGWVTQSKQLPDGTFQFELSHSLSRYAEESTMLEVTAEAITQHSILRRTKRFYLRDIIKPDSPQIVKCQEEDQDLNVTIEPPSSWSLPYSFFRLEHQIQYVLRDDGKTGCSLSAVIPKAISKLRVRSRDPLVPSAWSHWTAWKNVRTGKNLCKCRNTAKYCCPMLSPEVLEECRRKRERKQSKAAGMGQ